MDDWPDAKIRATALWYIGQHTMKPPIWRYTATGDVPPEALARAQLLPGELPVVGFFLSPENWYLLTTRRVVGAFAGMEVAVAALDVFGTEWGDFKGRDGNVFGTLTLLLMDGTEAKLQYETGRASMAPIYYFRYWWIKYPVLDKLKDDPNATSDSADTTESQVAGVIVRTESAWEVARNG